MFRAIILFILLSGVQNVSAQDPMRLLPVKDLKSKWLTVDRSGQKYIPYINKRSLQYPVVGLMLDTLDVSGLTLELCVPEGTSVFVNNKIVDRTRQRGCLYYDLDSLKSVHAGTDLFLSLFRENLDPTSISTTLMTRQPVSKLLAETESTLQIKRRSHDQFADFFIVAVLIMLAFYAFLINRYPKGNRDFFNVSKAFSLTLKEEKVLTQRNMSTANAMFFCLYSMSIALVIILFWSIFGGIPELLDFISLNTFWSCLFSWVALSAIAFCVVELKYLLIRTLCSLLNVAKIAQIHFFDFIRIGLIFICTVLVVASVLYLTNLYQMVPFTIVLYAFISLLGVRIVILLLKLIGDTSFRKIHLISYLCTTEILPLLIGIRIFF
ncbi:MAG: hypothetical protein DHS20C17_00360 [Cyclobacteriaceae bacterium]|nr:MAG: hypothetical protein DHS20C17_00360 [Cyclobacteriaceae bacterium]